MGVFESQSEVAKSLRGVHLYHFALSNCSQRCRFALEVKGVKWHSHHRDLSKREHITPEYLAINPNGVVPTLVHDGLVVLESNDIIDYIDETFPGVDFKPKNPAEAKAVRDLLDSSSQAQTAIKALSHEYLFSARRQQISLRDIHDMKKAGASDELIGFLSDYCSNGKEWADRLDAAHKDARARVLELERRLKVTERWLSGPAFGLADMSWAVNYYRLAQCRMSFPDAPMYEEWGASVVEMPAFQTAVVNYRP